MNRLFLFFFIFFLSLLIEKLWIRKSCEMDMSQVQKNYGPQSHILTKSKTPSMGGLMFLAVSFLCLFLFPLSNAGTWHESFVFWIFPWGAALIGFIDDWIKYKKHSSEGLPSLGKLVAQILLALPWAFWVGWYKGIYLWPNMELSLWLGVPLLAFIAIGMLNAVNVTDGLDGLAAGSVILSLVAFLVWLPAATYVRSGGIVTLAMCLAFLWYNSHPAAVFMGDVGSHFLAGVLISLCALSGFLMAVIPLGFIFGVEILTVSIQLIAIHKFKRKVFKMSPLHHHFELTGWSEDQIVTRFLILHGLGAIVCIFFLMSWWA